MRYERMMFMYHYNIDVLNDLFVLRNLVITLSLYLEEPSSTAEEMTSISNEMLEKANDIHRWFIRHPQIIDDEIWKWVEEHEQEK